MDGTFPLYCELCKKSFSGPTPAEQHFTSKDHQKRECLPMSGFDCDICHVQINSAIQHRDHCASPAHQERVRRGQQDSGYSPRNNPQEARPSRPYDFDGVRGVCYVCNIELTSPQHAQQHLNGTKHKKKETQNSGEIGTSGPGPLFCNLCSVPFSSEGNAREHYRSAKHIKKEKESEGQNFPNTENSSYQRPATVQQIAPVISLFNASPVPKNLPDPLLPQQGHSSSIPLQNNINSTTTKAVEFNGQTGYCNVCKVDLTSPQLMEQHLSGSRHEKSLKQWTGSHDQDLKCDVSFSGPAQMQQHFENEKYKKLGLPHTNFSLNDPMKPSTKFQINQSVLFPTELFPSEENLFQCQELSSMPLNILPDNSTQTGQNPLGHSNCSDQCRYSDSSQFQTDLCLKVGGGNIFGTATGQNDLIAANSLSSSDTCYSRASLVLNNMISEQNAATKQNTGTTQPFTFSGDHGWCNICNIELKSVEHAHDHLTGTDHRLKVEESPNRHLNVNDNNQELNKLEYSFDGSKGFCNVCQVLLTSRQHAEQHLQGKSHTKAKMCWNSVDVKTLPTNSSLTDDKPEYEFRGGRGVCYICNIDLTSNAHAEQHLQGKNHKKAKERKQQQKDGNIHPLFCEVCHVKCSGPESAAQHFKSAKHLQKISVYSDGISHSNSEFPNLSLSATRQINQDPNIDNVTRCCLESSKVYTSPIQTQPKTLDSQVSTGILSNSVLSSLRPAPNNLSLCVERLQSFDENQLINLENISGKTANTTIYRQNTVKQEMVVPEITTSSPIPIKKTCDVVPLSTQAFSCNSGDDNNDLLESSSNTGQARRQQKHNPLQNRNHSRGNKFTVNLDDGASCEDVENLFQGMDISETNELDDLVSFNSGCSEFLKSDLETVERHGCGVSGKLAETCPISTIPKKPKSNPYGSCFKYFCDICNRPMNTKEAYTAHINGRDHQQKAANIRAPRRELPQVLKTLSEDEAYDKAYKLVKNNPRTYQVELFSKTMMNDTIIFLPTGTGKTLVAAMTLSYMLEANPHRPVLFLVDKVLLVLQQSKYLHEQFDYKNFLRGSPDNPSGPLESRKLKIATLCSGIAASDPTPLYQYDVIVAVAAYCYNLMSQERIYWTDFSVVVFDEAHHCTKKHPFNWLLHHHHATASPASRPKVLGLTASPAGKETVEATFIMLKDLLGNLGNAKVGIVENETAKDQLKKYQSNAKLHIKFEPRTNEEEDFRKQLLVYLVSCYLKLDEMSNIDKDCSFMSHFKPRLSGGTREEQLLGCTEELNDPDRIKLFMHVLGIIKPKDKSPALQVKSNLDFLSNHTLIMLMSLQDMDGMGIPCCMQELQPLLDSKYIGNFEKAELLGLNCDKLRETVKAWQHSAKVSSEFQADEQRMSLVKQLLSSLRDGQYLNWQEEGNERPMALVLVRERVLAFRLSKFLQGIDFVRDLHLKVTAVVGHGGGTADHGMRVKEQMRVLNGVKQKRYQIIVATSVAEEGVDIPECELVICMNLPGTVTGFVQMRGRARKKDSHFVIICSNKKEKEQMNNLLMREKNMMQAAQLCIAEEKKEDYKHS